MRAYVGVADGDWCRFLAERPEVDEVNFWRPSSKNEFHRLEPGEPFFFKSHYPHNRVVGGGFYSGFAKLRVSVAWELYREGNGAVSIEQMRARIDRYRRRRPIIGDDDPIIGCIFVRDVRFFPPDDDVGPPPDFASNIVQGKGYDLSDYSRVDFFRNLLYRLLDARVQIDLSQSWSREGPVYGDPRLAPRRLGQRAFQAVVLNAYDQRCSITGSRIRPVLQAAHIRPLSEGGEHRLDNGLLLRSDIHTLFDRGYIGVDLDHKLLVSSRIRQEFGAENWFYRQAGKTINLPDRRSSWPSREFLKWHEENVFLG